MTEQCDDLARSHRAFRVVGIVPRHEARCIHYGGELCGQSSRRQIELCSVAGAWPTRVKFLEAPGVVRNANLEVLPATQRPPLPSSATVWTKLLKSVEASTLEASPLRTMTVDVGLLMLDVPEFKAK